MTSATIWFSTFICRWTAMVYLPQRGNFVDQVFLIAYYFASILQHVSHLAMGALPVTACYIRYPYKKYNTIGNY